MVAQNSVYTVGVLGNYTVWKQQQKVEEPSFRLLGSHNYTGESVLSSVRAIAPITSNFFCCFNLVIASILFVHVIIYNVVQFYPWFKFYFPLFLNMVMYDSKFQPKEKKIQTMNHNIHVDTIVCNWVDGAV